MRTESAGWQPTRAGRATRAGDLDVVMLDASLRQSLVAVRSLGRVGHAVGALEVRGFGPLPAFASRWCIARATTTGPPGSDAAFDDLLALLDQRRVGVVIPAHDGTIEVIRRRRDEVERRTKVALAPEPALAAAIDKAETLRIAEKLELRVPRSAPVLTVGDVSEAVAQVGLPAVVRPTCSWVQGGDASRRLLVALVSTVADARLHAGQMLDQGACVVVQELIPGAREAVSFVHVDGRFHGSFAQRADRTLPVLGGSSVWRQSIPLPPDAAADARELLEALGLEGYAEVEFRRDVDGRPVLMEINPRLSASVELAVRAGVDFPDLILRWARGDRLPAVSDYRVGARMRWLGGDLGWLRETWRNQGVSQVDSRTDALFQFARSTATRASYDYVDLDDLMPLGAALARHTIDVARRGRCRIMRSWSDA